MTAPYYVRHACRFCEANLNELVMELAPTPAGDKFIPESRLGEEQPLFPLNLALCTACGLLQLAEVVDPKLLYGDYLYETSISLNLPEHFQAYAQTMVTRFGEPSANSLVVEIGCNDGTLLRAFREKGFRVLGVEPAEEIARRVNESGMEVVSAFFTSVLANSIRSSHGTAFIVCANNVLANIDDLDDVFGGIRALLDPRGVFVFESGYGVDLVKNGVIDNIYHEHLSYFSVKPIQTLLKKHGLELIAADRVETKGGSIRYVAQKDGGHRPVESSVRQWLDLETREGFGEPGVYRKFASNMAAVREDVRREVLLERGAGRRVAGYGASVGVTTLLYYYGIKSEIDFFVDDNKIKQGLYSPGSQLPVLSSEALYERKPATVVLFPWRYVAPIVQRHGRFLREGGRFLVPLPEVRWLP